MNARHNTEWAGNRWSLLGKVTLWHQVLQISAFLPACVGVVMIEIAVTVGELTSSLVEDAAVSSVLPTVKFCCDGTGAMTEVPLDDWLRFFWAVWRVMVMGTVGAVSSLGLSWRNSIKPEVWTQNNKKHLERNLENIMLCTNYIFF